MDLCNCIRVSRVCTFGIAIHSSSTIYLISFIRISYNIFFWSIVFVYQLCFYNLVLMAPASFIFDIIWPYSILWNWFIVLPTVSCKYVIFKENYLLEMVYLFIVVVVVVCMCFFADSYQ